jgi:acyl-coenzyme A synthetase/AMP-(fatty) acid ligase
VDLLEIYKKRVPCFVGHKDHMIKIRKERAIPREMENVLCGLASVAAVAVIPAPDDILGPSH